MFDFNDTCNLYHIIFSYIPTLYIRMIVRQRIFQQGICIRFANVMNGTTIICTIKSETSSTTDIKTRQKQIMTTITNRFLKFIPIIKIPIVANYLFFPVITFSNISFLTYINYIVIHLL